MNRIGFYGDGWSALLPDSIIKSLIAQDPTREQLYQGAYTLNLEYRGTGIGLDAKGIQAKVRDSAASAIGMQKDKKKRGV